MRSDSWVTLSELRCGAELQTINLFLQLRSSEGHYIWPSRHPGVHELWKTHQSTPLSVHFWSTGAIPAARNPGIGNESVVKEFVEP